MDKVSLETLRKHLVTYLPSIDIICVWLKKPINLGKGKYLYYPD